MAMTGLHRAPSTTSRDRHGGTRQNGGGRNEDPLNWCAWAHQGHRLWVGMPDSFWVYTYKVERCPFPGNHVWMSCPYAHRGERAHRRDPSRFLYATASCPEYEESKRQLQPAGSNAPPTCSRGLRCSYAHGIFETLMHPTRLRTVMCDGGTDCPCSMCFFAHCLALRRREDDEVPLVIFPATPPAAGLRPARAPRPPASVSSRS
ncbi:unnamed protein product [Miscanthus lutarioriparius]|uniref:AtC3H23-like CCCH zinc finger domain-containing protein n=1 Tax=Miscanthus lutarioriparius TaxID=422564 RepID=A0A811NH36_9POAL|nr:unnamed protein product [Miscanthus lutarioriparius]